MSKLSECIFYLWKKLRSLPDCYIWWNDWDHDLEWEDTSFDHEFGTESCGFWHCINCDHIDEGREPPGYEESDFFD